MNIDGKEIIFRGHGSCSTCGIQFEGEPMETFQDMKKHEVETGHKVWSDDQIIDAQLNSDPPEDRGD